MPRKMKFLLPALLLCLLLAAGGVALAQSGGPYDLSWHTFDGGGGAASGGPYTLQGTAGQADAAPVMSGGAYTLQGGFWAATANGPVYLPLVQR